MVQARITAIEYGARVVSLISEIKKHAGVSLSEAKQIVERVIDGESVSIELRDERCLSALKEAAESLGARVQ
jgi:ribosomal protein L7/L12